MTDFAAAKKELANLLNDEGISFRDWGDAVSIHFSDGCDDLYYTPENRETPAALLKSFQELDPLRSRILNALRHAAVRRGLYLELDRSGSWSVGTEDGASWTVEVGSELTRIIREQGEAEAFRAKLKELVSWESGIGCLGAVITGGIMIYKKQLFRGAFKIVSGIVCSIAGCLAKNLTKSVPVHGCDAELLAYIDSHAAPPEAEKSWEDFENIEDEQECIELFPETEDGDDGKDSGNLLDMFSINHKAGPELVILDPEKTAELDRETAEIIRKFHESVKSEMMDYDKLFLPWLDLDHDDWISREYLVGGYEDRALEARRKDDFWMEINALETLLILGCDKYRERTRYLMDEWWRGGGHDMQDYIHLLNAFPDHPAAKEMLEPEDLSPEHSMEARRRIEVDLYREWVELKQTDEVARGSELNDILEILHRLSPELIRLFLTEEQTRHIHDFCINAAKGAKTEDLQFSHEHILSLAWKMDWPEIAKTLRQRDDYTALLIGFCLPAEKIEEMAGNLSEKISNAAGVESEMPKEIPDVYDTCYFDKTLLTWSLFIPDEFTLRLIATALGKLDNGRGSRDDYLACAVAWHRCRSK